MTAFRQNWLVAKTNLRHNLLPHLLLGAAVTALTPVLFGVGNLQGDAVWAPLEMFACLNGAALLTPACAPELNDEIAQTVDAKPFSTARVTALRILVCLLALAALTGLLVAGMRASGSAAGAAHWAGGCANAVFLGGVGALVLAASGNLTAGYMAALIVYAASYSGDKLLGPFFLFSGAQGRPGNKPVLFAAGAALLVLVPAARELRRRQG